MDAASEHWESAYADGDERVSWFQAEAATSLRLIEAVSTPLDRVIDVGGGSSPLVDSLLARGHREVAVLDLADAGLEISRKRLGAASDRVDWIVADLLDWQPSAEYDVWHDRAVLHFLTEEHERSKYLGVLRSALKIGGHVVIGVFAEDGPEKCSGLSVRRYSKRDLESFLGPEFEPVSSLHELHGTPGGNQQSFNWLTARRIS